jgi:hypothetical protein
MADIRRVRAESLPHCFRGTLASGPWRPSVVTFGLTETCQAALLNLNVETGLHVQVCAENAMPVEPCDPETRWQGSFHGGALKLCQVLW